MTDTIVTTGKTDTNEAREAIETDKIVTIEMTGMIETIETIVATEAIGMTEIADVATTRASAMTNVMTDKEMIGMKREQRKINRLFQWKTSL